MHRHLHKCMSVVFVACMPMSLYLCRFAAIIVRTLKVYYSRVCVRGLNAWDVSLTIGAVCVLIVCNVLSFR